MRCKACDERLTAREATRKGEHTKEYLDLCDKCVATIADQIGIDDSALNAGQEESDDYVEQATTVSDLLNQG